MNPFWRCHNHARVREATHRCQWGEGTDLPVQTGLRHHDQQGLGALAGEPGGGNGGAADQLSGAGETHGGGVFAKKCTAALSGSKGRVSGGGINRSFPISTREHP